MSESSNSSDDIMRLLRTEFLQMEERLAKRIESVGKNTATESTQQRDPQHTETEYARILVKDFARQRAWKPVAESVNTYFFDKYALLRAAFENLSNAELCEAIRDGLPFGFRRLICTTLNADPRPEQLQREMTLFEHDYTSNLCITESGLQYSLAYDTSMTGPQTSELGASEGSISYSLPSWDCQELDQHPEAAPSSDKPLINVETSGLQ